MSMLKDEVLCVGNNHVYNPHVQTCQCGQEQWPQPGRSTLQKGWQCPQCAAIHGPHVNTCENCLSKGEVLEKSHV